MPSAGGKRVLVTGSGAGLGREIALRLATKQAELVLWDLDAAGNEETARLVREAGAKAETHTVNLADPAAIASAASAVGDVWAVVNNAGIVTGEPFLTSSDERNELSFRVNTFASFHTAKKFVPAMIKANDGVFVTVSSVASYVGAPNMVDYASSKAAARAFIETLAQEVAIEAPGVHFACACPGYMNTELFSGFAQNNSLYAAVNQPLPTTLVAQRIVDGMIEGRSPLGVWPHAANAVLVLRGIWPERLWRMVMWPALRPLMNSHDSGKANKIFDQMAQSKL